MKQSNNPKRSGAKEATQSLAEVEEFIETNAAVSGDGLGPRWMLWKRKRYIVIFITYLGEMTKEVLRTNISVAVLPMTENRTVNSDNGSTTYVQEFEWDSRSRGLLLSVFFFGFVSTQIPGGVLAVRHGGSRLYGLGVLLTAVFTLLTPAVARANFNLLLALRVLEGMCEGILKPSVEMIYARWILPEERSSLVAVTVSGNTCGVVIGMFVSSAIASKLGWPAIFYITGSAGILWYVAWFFIVAETPARDKRISRSEREYIQRSLGQGKQRPTKKIPYASILTSGPLLALIVSYIPNYCCYVMLTTQLPTYIRDVLKLDTKNSGYLSTMPFIAEVLGIYVSSPIADFLVARGTLSVTAVRKLYICGALVVMSASGILMRQASSVEAAMTCLVLMDMCAGAAVVQVLVNMLDLAPRYSSVQSGLTATSASACAMFIPMIVGYLTQDKTAEGWHQVFYIQAGITLTAGVTYGLFGSGRLQTWANEADQET